MPRASQFKYKSQKMNDIRKPTPLRDGQSGLNIQSSGSGSVDENKKNFYNYNATHPRKSSQFYNAASNNLDSLRESE